MTSVSTEDPIRLDPNKELYIIPFGGCGEFGMNLTAYVCRGKLYIVDCGIMFPDQSKLGVDAIVPELTPWFKMFGNPQAYIITHGHEDHIGGLPICHERWPAPIYATPWTTVLIKNRFEKYYLPSAEINTVQAGDTIRFGEFNVHYVHMNHSIPDTCSLLVSAGKARVFHTGDFKIDNGSRYEEATDLEALRKISGVTAILADSTNATSPGRSKSEDYVREPLREVFQQIERTIFFTTFASNWWRLRTVFELAAELERKVLILGAGLNRTLSIARDLRMLSSHAGIFIEESQISHVAPEQLLVVASGCQGEPMSAMGRLSRDEQKGLRLANGDGVVFSSRSIPGAERAIAYLASKCAQRGVRVFNTRTNPGIHVSGHAYAEDLQLLIETLKPHSFVAVHGTFTQLIANRSIAESCGVTKTYAAEDGRIYAYRGEGLEEVGSFDVDWQFVDGFSRQLVDRQTIKQRLKIGEMGLVVLSGVYDSSEHIWASPPTFDLRGLVVPEHENWEEEAADVVVAAISGLQRSGMTDSSSWSEAARVALRRYLQTFYHKKVVVIAHIHSG